MKNTKKMRRLLTGAVLAGVVALTAMPAQAHTGFSNRLRFFDSDTGSAQWQYNRVDSPLDADASRIKLAVAEQDGDDYALAFANGTQVRNRLAGTVRNLSFDFLTTTYVGNGAPRISVDLDMDGDNDYDLSAFLAAFHCQEAIPSSTWGRADFTGRTTAGCSIFVGAETFTSDGVSSAWALFAAAHPTAKVLDAYVVMDEVGQSFIDRVAFQNHMFTRGANNASGIKHCPNEASC